MITFYNKQLRIKLKKITLFKIKLILKIKIIFKLKYKINKIMNDKNVIIIFYIYFN